MNKAKREAWRKHRLKRKKMKLKRKQEAQAGTQTSS